MNQVIRLLNESRQPTPEEQRSACLLQVARCGCVLPWPTITMRRLCASVGFGLLLTGCLHPSYRGHQAVFNICSSDVVRASAETLAPGSSAMFKAQLKLQLNPQGLSRFQNFMRACEEEAFELRVNDQLLLEAVGRGQP